MSHGHKLGEARRDRLIQEKSHDPYATDAQLPEPTVCSDCGLIYRQGRWQDGSEPYSTHETLCPACRRTRDDYPAGIVRLRGDFLTEHEQEIRGLVEHVEQRERREHPLKRLMNARHTRDALEIRTTDLQLARAIGLALQRAYGGELDYAYTKHGQLLRVTWER